MQLKKSVSTPKINLSPDAKELAANEIVSEDKPFWNALDGKMAPTLSLEPLCCRPELEVPGAVLVVSKKPPTGDRSHVSDVMNSPAVESFLNWKALLVPKVVPEMILPLADYSDKLLQQRTASRQRVI